MNRIINLTPHAVHLYGDNGIIVTFEPIGTAVRVELLKSRNTSSYTIGDGIKLSVDITDTTNGSIEGLPDPAEDVTYIVSSFVAQQARRHDLISPCTDSTAIRDSAGNVVGVRSFQRFL
jgi:hypothetical protein